MSRQRTLTIAAMKGRFALRFKDVANHDQSFSSVCGGTISVLRSANGTTYIVDCDIDHIRVFCEIVTPDDMPTLFYWDDASAYGWWHLEGYERRDFSPGGWRDGLRDGSPDDIANEKELPEPAAARQW